MKELDAAREQVGKAIGIEYATETKTICALMAIAEALTGILSILNDITARDGLLVKDGDRV